MLIRSSVNQLNNMELYLVNGAEIGNKTHLPVFAPFYKRRSFYSESHK